MNYFLNKLMLVKKASYLTLLILLFAFGADAQSNQVKAEQIITHYLSRNLQSKRNMQNIKFNTIEVLRSPFEETKTYKNLLHKVDSLKLEGKQIDARIAKMKTTAELNQAKKDSYRLSKELTTASDHLIDFITTYKGQQTGWMVKTVYRNKTVRKKNFYFNQELTKVDSVR